MFLRNRVIGPAMPSAETLAAAARLTEAEARLRYESPNWSERLCRLESPNVGFVCNVGFVVYE